VTTRLCSSGIARSNDRRPASIWKRSGENGVRVTLNDDGRWAQGCEELIERGGPVADLFTSRLASHTDGDVGRAHAELGEERFGEVGVEMLSGVHDVDAFFEEFHDLCELDDLGARSEYDSDRSGCLVC